MAITTHGSLSAASSFTAGDTLLITEVNGSYPATSWTLYYTLKKGADTYKLTSTASGADHAFTEAAEVTSKWKPGLYNFQKYVTNTSGQRKTLDGGTFRVNPNLAAQDPEVEQWREVLQFATDAIVRLAKERIVSYSVAGQSFTLTTVDEAVQLVRVAKKQVRDLEKAENFAAGQGGRNKVKFRM